MVGDGREDAECLRRRDMLEKTRCSEIGLRLRRDMDDVDLMVMIDSDDAAARVMMLSDVCREPEVVR